MIKYGGDGMKIRWDKKYLYWGLTALAVVAVSLCMIFVFFRWELLMAWLRRLITITTPILDGLVLAYLLTPILNWIETLLLKYVFKKRKSAEKPKYLRALSLVLTFLVVSAIVYAFCAVVLPQLFQSIQSIVRQFPAYVYNLNGWLDKVLKDNPNLEALLSQMISTYSPELREWLNTTSGSSDESGDPHRIQLYFQHSKGRLESPDWVDYIHISDGKQRTFPRSG